MALHFLQFSASYREATEPSIFRRREIVALHLNDNFKAGRNRDDEVFQAVKAELEKEEISIDRQDYASDKEVLRSSYLWLSANSDEERAESRARATITSLLERDGITAWAKVEELAGIKKGESSEAKPATAEIRLRLRDSKRGSEVAALITELIPQLEAMLQENEDAKSAALEVSEEVVSLKRQLDDANGLIELLEADNVSLEERLESTRESLRRARSATIEEIAAEHPEIPQLASIAANLRNAASGQKREDLKRAIERLPKVFTWTSDRGEISYKEPFHTAFVRLTRDEQDQVIRQLEALAAQGAHYASLHTRKHEIRFPFSPAGCFTSRGADDLRFTWKKNGSVIIHWLFRKGDSRVRQSEA